MPIESWSAIGINQYIQCEDCMKFDEYENRKTLYLHGVPDTVIKESLTQHRQRLLDEGAAKSLQIFICEICMKEREEMVRKILRLYSAPDDMIEPMLVALRVYIRLCYGFRAQGEDCRKYIEDYIDKRRNELKSHGHSGGLVECCLQGYRRSVWDHYHQIHLGKIVDKFRDLLYVEIEVEDWKTLVHAGVPEAIFKEAMSQQESQDKNEHAQQPKTEDGSENAEPAHSRIYAWLANVPDTFDDNSVHTAWEDSQELRDLFAAAQAAVSRSS